MCCEKCRPQTNQEETRIMDGAISAFPKQNAASIDEAVSVMPKGFYLIVGGQLATRHDTLREAQTQMFIFLQRVPNVVATIAEVIPREIASTLDDWFAV